MSGKDVEEIAYSWISTEINLVEGENMWQSQNPSVEVQQDNRLDLQIILQEMIDIIDNTA